MSDRANLATLRKCCRMSRRTESLTPMAPLSAAKRPTLLELDGGVWIQRERRFMPDRMVDTTHEQRQGGD